MTANSKAKGKRGELELVNELKKYGYDAMRSQQYSGALGDADVVGLPGIHIECKRTEHLRLYEAVEQAKSDSRIGSIPAVFHRKNNKEWLVILTLDGFMDIYGLTGTITKIKREEIVRCRDCKHLNMPEWDNTLAMLYGEPPLTCDLLSMNEWRMDGNRRVAETTFHEVEPNGFCAWGERKGDD